MDRNKQIWQKYDVSAQELRDHINDGQTYSSEGRATAYPSQLPPIFPSFQTASRSSSDLSSDIKRILQLRTPDEVNDDASSSPNDFILNESNPQGSGTFSTSLVVPSSSDLNSSLPCGRFISGTGQEFGLEEVRSENGHTEACAPASTSSAVPSSWMPPSPSAYLAPRCALWDCSRPAEDKYCCQFHQQLAFSEGIKGRYPVMRPGGITVTDHLLMDALEAKLSGEEVGIPTCDRAAANQVPWESPALFNVRWAEGESVREWLFFDRAHLHGSSHRKQRTLPGYQGRGWHESRKIHFPDFQGLKRVLYLDPQPEGDTEWHLYEYEVSRSNRYALHRLQMKKKDSHGRNVSGKASKSSTQGKEISNSLGRGGSSVKKSKAQPTVQSGERNDLLGRWGTGAGAEQYMGGYQATGPYPLPPNGSGVIAGSTALPGAPGMVGRVKCEGKTSDDASSNFEGMLDSWDELPIKFDDTFLDSLNAGEGTWDQRN